MLNKETFHKKWYYRLLQVVFWGSFIFFFVALMVFGILGIFYEDDMPFVGFFWAGVLVGMYWFIKRIFYYVLFGESLFSRKKDK